jgi:hypothetical protein
VKYDKSLEFHLLTFLYIVYAQVGELQGFFWVFGVISCFFSFRGRRRGGKATGQTLKLGFHPLLSFIIEFALSAY